MAQTKRRRPSGSGARKKKPAGKLKAGQARVSKDGIAFNPKGVEAGRRRPRIPEGDYPAELHDVEVGKTKDQPGKSIRPLVLWKFRVTEGKYEGTEIWYRTVIQDGSVPGEKSTMWDLRRTLEALGVKLPDDEIKIQWKKLIGRTCAIQVIDGEPYNGRISSEINDIYSESLLEEDEEEEYDEDEEFEDEDEGDEEDWDEDEEDEEEDELYDEDELKSMSAQEVRAAGRQLGVVKKGMKKADIIEAILDSQEDSDEEEDWEDEEDEVDLDEDDL